MFPMLWTHLTVNNTTEAFQIFNNVTVLLLNYVKITVTKAKMFRITFSVMF